MGSYHYVPDNEHFKPFGAEIASILEKEVEISHKDSEFLVSTKEDKPIVVARFYLAQLQGCCGVCVSYNSMVMPKFRKKGIGKILNAFRIYYARKSNYGLLLCTDQDSNVSQKKILNAKNWQQIYQFTNPKTKHLLNVHVYDLTKPS